MDDLNDTTRRKFLTTAGSTVGLTILPSARTAFAYEANERLQLAICGGKYNANHFLGSCHIYETPIVAMCDPNRSRLDRAFEVWKGRSSNLAKSNRPAQQQWVEKYRDMADGKSVKIYSDVRRMFDEMADSIDALVVSNYDQFLGISCGQALRAGKPVCNERPFGLNITEARQLRALAAKTPVPVTYCSYAPEKAAFRRAMELVEDGEIGQVKEAHVWFKRGGPNRGKLPEGSEAIPAHLDWDSWLGPLPWREYHSDWMRYDTWRETCTGMLGSFANYATVFPYLALKLRGLWDEKPAESEIRATAECSSHNRISFPRWERVRWEIPARGEMAPLTITWHNGPDYAPGTRELLHNRLRPFGIENAAEAENILGEWGSMIIGENGAFVSQGHGNKITALPKAKFPDFGTAKPIRIPPSRGTYRDWIDACRGDEKPHILANFDNGGPLSELLMLGEIATLYPEETLAYDPALGRITNKPEANQHVDFEPRQGWEI